MKAVSKELLLAGERVETKGAERVDLWVDTRADQTVAAWGSKMVVSSEHETVEKTVAYLVEKSAGQLGLRTDNLST